MALLCAAVASALVPRSTSAQVLARPGWAGSGVAPESWWKRAIFYRIDPDRFQDSDRDSRGDLPGIAQRMDYLQSVGVDALLLDAGHDAAGLQGLDDLIHEGSRHHLRLLLAVDPAAETGSRVALLSTVRSWLSAGAAGVWLPKSELPAANAASYAELTSALRSLLQSFPGERVLLTEPVNLPLNLAPRPVPVTRRIEPGSFAEARGRVLMAGPALPVASADLAALRQALAGAAQGADPNATPLLRFAQDPATASPNAVADAAMLLASRGAAVFNAGDEIGLNLSPDAQKSGAPPPVMQWTPSNRTPAPIERPDGSTPKPTAETEFGSYHPYMPPPPGSLTGPNPAPPRIAVDANIPAALPDPDTLPGYTAGSLAGGPVDKAKRNVVVEDRDPRSLLNAYRQLIGLHHGNATLRNGTQFMLNRDAEGALVWLRRAPAGSRTVANVVVAANLSEKPVALALDSDIEALGMRGGTLRPLFASCPEPLTGEMTEHLTLPPHAVYIGEIFHTGAMRPEPAPERHARGRSRHRVRR